MAIKPIIEFKGDSWKKQKEESPRAHHYFKQYKKQNLSKDKFIKLLLAESDERTSEGQIKFYTNDATFNKKNQKQIQLYIDTEGKKGQCPKPCGAVIDWFNFHKWFKRKQDYDAFKDEEADILIRAMITKEKPELAKQLINNIKDRNELRKELQDSNKLTLKQDESGAKATNTDIDSLKKLANDDATKIDANVKADVEADVNQKISEENKLRLICELADEMEKMDYD